MMYPEPENCLDLHTWQEFFGFDQEGEFGWFGFEFDREHRKIRLIERKDSPLPPPGPAKPVNVPRDPSGIKKRKVCPLVSCDFTGRTRGEYTAPGPFDLLE